MKEIFNLNILTDGLSLLASWQGNLAKLTLTNEGACERAIGDLTLFNAEMPFAPDTRIYGEGYNMLSQYDGTVKEAKLFASYGDYGHYKLYKPEGLNQVYNMLILYPKDEKPVLIGFASCYRFCGWIRFNENVIQIAINGENAKIAPGETIALEEVYIEQGEYNEIIENFAKAIGKNHPRREFDEIPTGWCSWLVYGPDVTAQNIYDNLDAIKRHNLNLKYIQIDDGYQAHWGDWFDFTDKFEGGVKKVCLDIKEKGFEPAIWVAPFVAEKESKLLKNHPDWFVKGEDGLPLPSDRVTFGGWRCAPWYILDMTHPEARNYVREVFTVMRQEWQVKYFKLDAIIWAALPFGHRYDDNKTAVEAYRMGMQTICDAVGDESFILGGNSPMWPSIGYINGMRVTNDNYRRWAQFKQLAAECFPRNWQHGRLWINDPDTILQQNRQIKAMAPDGSVTYRDSELSLEEFAFNAVYTMACGGMVLSGDDVSVLSESNIEILKKLTPPTDVAAIFDDNTWTVGRAKIDKTKTTVYIFNFDDDEKDIEIKVDGEYHVYDYLNDKDLGRFKDSILLRRFKAHYAVALICTK